MISQIKYYAGIETEVPQSDSHVAEKISGLSPEYIPMIQENLNLKSCLKFKKLTDTRVYPAKIDGQELESLPEFQSYRSYLSQALPENSSLPLEAYNTLPFNPDFLFSVLKSD